MMTTDDTEDESVDSVHMITPTQQMISSTIGALFTSIIVTPLDVVKIRLQAQQNNSSFLHLIVRIGRTEGLGSLWSGLPPTLLMAMPATVVFFTVYDRLRADLWSWQGTDHQPMWIPVFCGAAARCVAATAISPIEMVRTKMQSRRLTYPEVTLAIQQLIKVEGILSLWRGLGPTLMRDVPFSSIYWASYEFMKERTNQRKPTLQFSLTAGAAAGSIAAVATLPFDVAKTNRQIELGNNDSLGKQTRTSGKTFHILKRIYRQNGVSGLFSGIAPRVIKVAPSCAIMISCYELGKQFFASYNSNKMPS